MTSLPSSDLREEDISDPTLKCRRKGEKAEAVTVS